VLAGWRSWAKARDLYRRISVPVTLVYGENDWSRHDERERTRSLLPGTPMITLKHTGHFSAVENPTELAQIILEGRRR
jgi:pimeloyl-ACP methyl ester carboxylesterase